MTNYDNIADDRLTQIGHLLLLASGGDERALMQLQVWALMYHPRAAGLSEALFAATGALKEKKGGAKARSQRGRRPTAEWATNVTVTARLLELCCGMDEATAKKHAAERWNRNLRSVQRYVKEHKENIAEALELIWLVPDMNLQE